MNLTAISGLMTNTLEGFGDQVLVVLTAVIGIAIAYFLFKWIWNYFNAGLMFDPSWERKKGGWRMKETHWKRSYNNNEKMRKHLGMSKEEAYKGTSYLK